MISLTVLDGLALTALLSLCLVLRLARRLRLRLQDLEQGQRRLEAEAAERQRSQEELRALDARFREVARSANDAIVSADPQGRIVFWNRGAGSIFGWKEKEALGMPVIGLLGEPYRDGYRLQVERHQRANATRFTGEVFSGRGVQKSGADFALEFTLACWQGPGGLHTTLVGRDVTQRKLAEEALARQARALVHQARELERSNEDLEQFAGAVSHDLREPLRKIAGCAGLLSDRYRERLDEKATRCLDLMVDGARRLQAMIDDLLGYCRAGQRDFRPGPTDLGEVFDRVCANLEVAIREADARITRDPLPTLCADPALLERVLQNLLANAVKFRTAEPPQIHVSAAREVGGWTVSVRDDGIGIDPRDSASLFVPFRRLHTRAEFPGTGVGLALCRRIVERHGGRIWVESQVGAGSTFRFHMPDGASTSPAAEPSKAAVLVRP